MTVLTEGMHTGEYLVSEASGTRSREVVTLVSGQSVVAGEVLGKITASGKYAAHDEGASDGTENAVAISFAAVDASSADANCVITARDSEVNGTELTWPDGIAANDKTDGIASLATVGIIVR